VGRVIHFEIHSSDLDRAERFYTAVFGWTVTRWDGAPIDYRLITTGTDAKVAAAGGEQVLDRMEIPGVGWVSYFKDTEGNVFGALQSVAA
jgi:predicted enzyme related to lactoylglutathione lyase